MFQYSFKPIYTKMYFGPEEDEAKAKADTEAARLAAEEANKPRFTQKDLDKHVGSFKYKLEAQLKTAATEALKLAEDKRLTQDERDAHAKRAEDLEAQFKTQKELAEQGLKKIETKYQADLKAANERATKLEELYHEKMVDSELSDALTGVEESIPGKLKKTLRSDTVIVDEVDDNGKVTTNKVVKINLDAKDKEGKPIKLLLTPKEAVKHMRETPDEWGIFFKGEGGGGLGGNNSRNSQNSGPMPEDTAAYFAKRNAKK